MRDFRIELGRSSVKRRVIEAKRRNRAREKFTRFSDIEPADEFSLHSSGAHFYCGAAKHSAVIKQRGAMRARNARVRRLLMRIPSGEVTGPRTDKRNAFHIYRHTGEAVDGEIMAGSTTRNYSARREPAASTAKLDVRGGGEGARFPPRHKSESFHPRGH